MHEQTTGQEILRDTDGQVDVFIAGVGTGGTLTGVGRALKKHNPQIQVVAVEPLSSPVLSGGVAAPHQIQGIGAGFIPKIYDASVVDHIIPIADDDAYRGMQLLTKHEGLFCGISAGAALMAAIKTAQRPEYEDATIVVLLPDTGDRYLSLVEYK